jgi:hypothetical protein
MQLSREGLICGPSSGMALQGLFNVLQKYKDQGNLQDLAGDDGITSCVFLCCDLPFQYLNDYFTKLGEDHFHPIVNEVRHAAIMGFKYANLVFRIYSTPTSIYTKKNGISISIEFWSCSTQKSLQMSN